MPNETWKECEIKVQEMFMGIEENIEIDRCHRITPKKKDPTRPRTIICRITLSCIMLQNGQTYFKNLAV